MKKWLMVAAAMSVGLARAGEPVDLGKAGTLDAIQSRDDFFTLDDTGYHVNVVLAGKQPTVQPAKP